MEYNIGFPKLQETHPTLFKFSNSKARIRVVKGPAGSAKTSYVAIKLLEIACSQHPDQSGVRHSRFLIIRNIYKELSSATKETMRLIMNPLVTFTNGDPPEGKGVFRLADGTSVSIKFDFLAMDSPNAYNTLLGYEPTAVYFDEINKVSEEAVLAAARRVGRYPSALQTQGQGVVGHCVLGTCNGPIKNSWLHKWTQGEKDDQFKMIEKETGGQFFEMFSQPPALLRPLIEGDVWKENPAAENVQNLQGGFNYYFEMLAGNDQDIQAFVEGEWADLPIGKRVWPMFSGIHVMKEEKISELSEAGLFLAFDYGRTPVCLVGIQNIYGGLVITDELMDEQAGVSTLYTDKILPTLKKRYPRGSIISAWGDPAGFNKDSSGENSPVSVLAGYGIEVSHPGSNNIEPRLEAVRKALTTLNGRGQPLLLISSRCTFLIKALYSTYIYEQSRMVKGDIKDLPTKSHVDWVSDLADALQYICMGYFGYASELADHLSHPMETTKFNWV